MDDCLDLHHKCDLDVLQAWMKVLNRDKWWLEAGTKTKLRTFIQVFDRKDPRGLIKCNLSRNHCSLISHLKCRVLPLKLEVGRFNNTKIEKRLCTCCTKGAIESEMHFVNDCSAYSEERKVMHATVKEFVDTKKLKDEKRLKALLKNVVKITARYIEQMFDKQKALTYE